MGLDMRLAQTDELVLGKTKYPVESAFSILCYLIDAVLLELE